MLQACSASHERTCVKKMRDIIWTVHCMSTRRPAIHHCADADYVSFLLVPACGVAFIGSPSFRSVLLHISSRMTEAVAEATI